MAERGKALLLMVLQLACGAGYLLISLGLIMYLEQVYLIRRETAPLILGFFLLVLCQVLLGLAFFPTVPQDRGGRLKKWRRLVPKGTMPSFLSIAFLALMWESAWSATDHEFLTALLLVYLIGSLGEISLYQLALMTRKPGQRYLYSLGLLVWLLLFQKWAPLERGRQGEMTPLLFVLLLQLAAICARPVWTWIVCKRTKEREMEGGKHSLRRTAGLTVGGVAAWLLIFFLPGELLEVEPRQDPEGYYMLCSREGFVWFVDQVRSGQESINARLTADILLNDTENWENWQEEPPKHQYGCMIDYNGCFDGNGYTLEGYYSGQQAPIFLDLGEEAQVLRLTVGKSWFQTNFEEASYLDDEGELQVLPAASLYYRNRGKILD